MVSVRGWVSAPKKGKLTALKKKRMSDSEYNTNISSNFEKKLLLSLCSSENTSPEAVRRGGGGRGTGGRGGRGRGRGGEGPLSPR